MPDKRNEDPSTTPVSGDVSHVEIGIRRHRVALERAQRLHLGLDDEPMSFDAATVARMVQDIADTCEENDAFTLHAIVNALLGRDDHHVLVLQQKKRGKFISPTETMAKHNRNQKWLFWLAHREKNGIKTEAAIAEIAEMEGVSRATVFAGVKAAEDFLESGKGIFPESRNFDNPRSDLTTMRKG